VLNFAWAWAPLFAAVLAAVWASASVAAAAAAGAPRVPLLASCLHAGRPPAPHHPSSQSLLFLSLPPPGLVLPHSWSSQSCSGCSPAIHCHPRSGSPSSVLSLASTSSLPAAVPPRRLPGLPAGLRDVQLFSAVASDPVCNSRRLAFPRVTRYLSRAGSLTFDIVRSPRDLDL